MNSGAALVQEASSKTATQTITLARQRDLRRQAGHAPVLKYLHQTTQWETGKNMNILDDNNDLSANRHVELHRQNTGPLLDANALPRIFYYIGNVSSPGHLIRYRFLIFPEHPPFVVYPSVSLQLGANRCNNDCGSQSVCFSPRLFQSRG